MGATASRSHIVFCIPVDLFTISCYCKKKKGIGEMKKQDVLPLLAYGIPWGFLALWMDQILLFGLAMGATGFLTWRSSRGGKLWLVIAGNAISAVLTLILLCWAYLEGFWQFELFGPFGWTVFTLALTIPVQAFCWNRYWGMLAAYFAVIAGFAGYLYSLMLGL